jgi:hypothetical protein
MFREDLVQMERDRCQNIAAKVAELAARGLWGGPEWDAESASADVASCIMNFIESGNEPEDVERTCTRLRIHAFVTVPVQHKE